LVIIHELYNINAKKKRAFGDPKSLLKYLTAKRQNVKG
jgi:hypothetical protein